MTRTHCFSTLAGLICYVPACAMLQEKTFDAEQPMDSEFFDRFASDGNEPIIRSRSSDCYTSTKY